MSVALQFNYALEATAGATRLALLDVSDSMEPVDLTGYTDVRIYVPVENLNNAFHADGEWDTVFTGLSAQNGANYLEAFAADQHIDGQKNKFVFDWNALGVSAETDLNRLQSNVWGSAAANTANKSANPTAYTYTPVAKADEVQQIDSILKLAGRGLSTHGAFMGTVFANYPEAVTNAASDDFLKPVLTLSDMRTEILFRTNHEDLCGYCDNVFIQAYDAYRFDSNYGKLALSNGDSISIPVKFEVTQTVNYDLSGSAIDGGDGAGGLEHSNPMLTFVVGSGPTAQEFTVMSQETLSNEVKYNLIFIAVGDSEVPSA
jgi:hypothetical protein